MARARRWSNIALSQSWLAVFIYRLRARMLRSGARILPDILDLVSRVLFRVQIGRNVTIGPGLMIPHGHVVIDGETTIGKDCQINPWVTIGLSNSRKVGFSVQGPVIGDHVHIGTGAKIIGPVTVGDYARIGANAVVVADVPANATAVGMPARIVAGAHGDTLAPGPDAQIAARMRAAIVEYKLQRCSLETLAATLEASVRAGTPALAATRSNVARAFIVLNSSADDGANPDVPAALEEIDAALRSLLESPDPAP